MLFLASSGLGLGFREFFSAAGIKNPPPKPDTLKHDFLQT